MQPFWSRTAGSDGTPPLYLTFFKYTRASSIEPSLAILKFSLRTGEECDEPQTGSASMRNFFFLGALPSYFTWPFKVPASTDATNNPIEITIENDLIFFMNNPLK